ncbi:MAG: hypothetical protein IPK71_29510 [Myxococcales bacterium]|nr:hypothetical protein [Myxococcales bacterium]
MLTLDYSRDLYRLKGAELLDPQVDAGGKARIRLKLQPQYGAEVSRVVEVPLREGLEGKEVDLEILPGYAVSPEVAAPQNLSGSVGEFAEAVRDAQGARRAVPRAPERRRVRGQGRPGASVVRVRSPPPADGDVGPEAVASYARTIVPIEKYIDGSERVRVRVRSVLR